MRGRDSWHLVLLSVVALGAASVQNAATAGVISTEQYLGSVERERNIERVDAVLAREDVRRQLEQLGVDPAETSARVDALTDEELQSLADDLQDLPAGGSLIALIGVVFIVLLILELVGVIDIFKKI